ncbi:hypothetical protein EXIGLDRAFT_765035 [Exidia glandulosa HHB12029]|uniref:PWWP domain-containing protein n=1 Tax=Exidia glandulosa HHB12029 TaxID=1314781 RepID=A0A165KSE5_EXIGL|nr:hypothetical protein EXIGLDRAFT_765035 [Exidia glandulosa HHB12029]
MADTAPPADAAAPDAAAAAPATKTKAPAKAPAKGKSKKAAAPKEAKQPTRSRPPREPKKKPEPEAAAAPEPVAAKRTARTTRNGAVKPPRNPIIAPIKIPKGRKGLPQGTIVWAKMPGFPWYPGAVFAENDGTIPTKVKSQKPDNAAKDKVHLIRFTGEKNRVTWGWIPAGQLQTFNESADADAKILKNQRYKSAKERREVRIAHRKALEALEKDGVKVTKAPTDDEDDDKEDEEPMDTAEDGAAKTNGDATAMEQDPPAASSDA